MQPSSVLLVSSDHFYWLGLEEMLRRQSEVRIVGVVRAHDEATNAALAHQPTFILVAADLVDAPLVALVRALHARSPRSKVVAIGQVLGHAEHTSLAELKLAGFLRWEEVSPERPRCILTLVRDADVCVASGAAMDALTVPDRRRRPRDAGLVLSERERTVMMGLAAGLTREEIAVRLHLSLETVKRVIAALREKFDASTTFVLGMKATLYGFAPQPV